LFCKREYQRGNVKATSGSADGDGTVDGKVFPERYRRLY